MGSLSGEFPMCLRKGEEGAAKEMEEDIQGGDARISLGVLP